MVFPYKKALLTYKKSAYAIYFLERKIKLTVNERANLRKEMARFKKAHDEHYATLKVVEKVLKQYGIRYSKRARGSKADFSRFDLILTLGGDGSFLEAARYTKDQVIMGINSSPSFSVGKLCSGNAENFECIIRGIIDGKQKLSLWPRLRLDLKGRSRQVDCVNDILIAHKNPAAMSRYRLEINGIKEEQRNSGLWISTAAGSSGAIKSAGGRAFNPREKLIQYMPRELHYGFKRTYCHKGGVLRRNKYLTVTSLMQSGTIFVDGTHFKMKFPFNTKLKVFVSPNPLRTITA